MGYVYKPKHQLQLGFPTSTGKVDCTAYSAAMAFDRHTLGGVYVSGRQVRLNSNEPYPDKLSPGLNIPQVIDVGFKWHVNLENRSGAPWSSLMAALKGGRGVILQGDYDQIPAKYSGQLTFKGDHAVYLNHVSNDGDDIWDMDPLRKAGPIYIPATVMRAYAEKLAKRWGLYPGLAFATTRVTPSIAVAQD